MPVTETLVPKFEKTVPLAWAVPEDFPSRYATNFVVQASENEVTLTFFEARPPLLLETDPEFELKASKIESIPAVCVARVVLTPRRAKELLAALAKNPAIGRDAEGSDARGARK